MASVQRTVTSGEGTRCRYQVLRYFPECTNRNSQCERACRLTCFLVTMCPQDTIYIAMINFALRRSAQLIPATTKRVTDFASTGCLYGMFLSTRRSLGVLIRASSTVRANVSSSAFAIVMLTRGVQVGKARTIVSRKFGIRVSRATIQPFICVNYPLFCPTYVRRVTRCAVTSEGGCFFPAFFNLQIVRHGRYFLSNFAIRRGEMVTFKDSFLAISLFGSVSNLRFKANIIRKTFFRCFEGRRAFTIVVPIVRWSWNDNNVSFRLQARASSNV